MQLCTFLEFYTHQETNSAKIVEKCFLQVFKGFKYYLFYVKNVFLMNIVIFQPVDPPQLCDQPFPFILLVLCNFVVTSFNVLMYTYLLQLRRPLVMMMMMMMTAMMMISSRDTCYESLQRASNVRELRASRSTEKQGRMECICFSSCKPRYVLEAVLALSLREKFRCTFLINQVRFSSEITRY